MTETMDDDEDPTPYIFESDAAAVRTFVREMVTQSIIPGMERTSAQWNDQVASRRRGISGKFMSLSKRFTTFGGRSAVGPAGGSSGGNYDANSGTYRPDTPEAILRKLADYAFMLRDFKLAQSTYELLCADFKNDKAWEYYAGANEMAALTTLMSSAHVPAKVRIETIDQQLETAYYSYTTRCGVPYYALRMLAFGLELLRLGTGSALDDAARWGSRILEDGLIGQTGHALLLERIASCYSARQAVQGLQSGGRSRKAAFYNTLAADAWLKLEKPKQAERSLDKAANLYDQSNPDSIAFGHMDSFIKQLRGAVNDSKPTREQSDMAQVDGATTTLLEPIQQASEQMDQGVHRKSLSSGALPPPSFDPLGAVPVSPTSPLIERPDESNDGFE